MGSGREQGHRGMDTNSRQYDWTWNDGVLSRYNRVNSMGTKEMMDKIVDIRTGKKSETTHSPDVQLELPLPQPWANIEGSPPPERAIPTDSL